MKASPSVVCSVWRFLREARVQPVFGNLGVVIVKVMLLKAQTAEDENLET